MIFAYIAVPCVLLIKFFRQAELLKTLLDFRMIRRWLHSRLSVSGVTIETYKHRNHIFRVLFNYSVVENKLQLECEVPGLIILYLLICLLIYYQGIFIFVFIRGIL